MEKDWKERGFRMVDEMKWFWSSFLHGSWKTGPHQMTYYDHVLYGGKQSTIADKA
jgi:hypothetical protein